MSAWPDKYVIGITGNIATGKSVVRRMLEHLGAYGIDADALGHRAIAKGAPGYLPVVDAFGRWILAQDGQVDRTKLARIVFSDREALKQLESIVHPLVSQAIEILVKHSNQNVIVIEAIKLLESGLSTKCDTIWVTYAPEEVQVARLMQKRNLNRESAQQRIAAQSSHGQKISAANVVIRNEGSFDDTWQQVTAAWKTIFPTKEEAPVSEEKQVSGEMLVRRARLSQASEIAEFISRVSEGHHTLNREEVMAEFSNKAFLLLKSGDRLVGLVGWQVENLVARNDSIFIGDSVAFESAVRALMDEVERASRELQCEVALLFLTPEQAERTPLWDELGYKECSIPNLEMRAWQEAATESMPRGSILRFKQLREDRVLRPV